MNVPTKKRPFVSEENSNDESTIKKAKFGEYFKGFFGSVIDVDKHVLQIQNRELYSKLMTYKKQLELSISTHEKNELNKTKRISALSNCLQEIVSDISTLSKSTLLDAFNNKDTENLNKINILNFYFCCQNESMEIENSSEQSDEFLTNMKASLKEVFTKILANINKQSEKLLNSSDQQTINDELHSEISRLKQHNAELISNQKKYEKRINELETLLSEEKEKVIALNNEKDDLNEYIELQERNIQRQELKIQHLENEKNISIPSEPRQELQNDSKDHQKKENVVEPDDKDSKIEELTNLLNMRLKEIESLRNEQKSMIENSFNIKKEVTEEDIAKSSLYHNILEKNNLLSKDLQYEKEKNVELRQDYNKLEDSLNRIKQLMSQEFSKQCAYLQNSFDNATKKFKTIESERDRIKMKYEQLKAEFQSKNFNHETYESLNKKFEERIKAKDNIINDLKNEIHNLKAELESKKTDLPNLSPEDAIAKEINSLKQTIESQKKQIDALSSEMDQIGQDYDELLIKYGKLEKDLQEKEDYKSIFAGEKVKFSVIQSQMKKEKAILKEKNNTLDNKISQQKRLLEEYIEKQKSLDEFRKTLEEENALLKKLSEESQTVARESSIISDLIRRQYEEVNIKLAEANKEILELKTKSIDYENQFKRLKEDINLKEKQLERYRYKSKDKDDVLFEMYRSRYNCTLCNKQRPIDSVIKTCYHIFCGQCIEERLIKTRNRKCPTCKESFDKKDVHQLYFS